MSSIVATEQWSPPAAVTVRGTVFLVPGRGESAAVYERFGARIAADGYLVRLVPDGAVAAAIDDSTPSPHVVVGSDTGALLALVAEPVDAVVAAGVVGTDAHAPDDWAGEVDARSACPVHRGRLDNAVEPGALSSVPRELVAAAAGATPRVPVLVVHGDADVVSPVATARGLADRLPDVRLVTVRGGRHDILNDLSHRSVAAEIVQFLERVRSDDHTALVLNVERP